MANTLYSVPYTQANAAESASKGHASRRVSSNGVISQMQAKLMQDVLSDETQPQHRAQAMRAYVEAEKLKRIIKGQPANTSQSIREPREKKQAKSAVSPLESLPDKPSVQ